MVRRSSEFVTVLNGLLGTSNFGANSASGIKQERDHFASPN